MPEQENNQQQNNEQQNTEQQYEYMFFECPFCHNKTAYIDYKRSFFKFADTLLFSATGVLGSIDSGTVFPYSFDVNYCRCLACKARWRR